MEDKDSNQFDFSNFTDAQMKLIMNRVSELAQ